jgi:hypothetical protein
MRQSLSLAKAYRPVPGCYYAFYLLPCRSSGAVFQFYGYVLKLNTAVREVTKLLVDSSPYSATLLAGGNTDAEKSLYHDAQE